MDNKAIKNIPAERYRVRFYERTNIIDMKGTIIITTIKRIGKSFKGLY